MGRGGKVSGKRNLRKRVRSKEDGSDGSDEDYVVSDEGGDASDCSEYYCSSLDGCASDDSFDRFVEEEEFQGVRKCSRSKAKGRVCGRLKNASKTSHKRGRFTYAAAEEEEEEKEEYQELEEEEEEYQEEEEEEEYKEEEEEEEYKEEEEEYKVDEEEEYKEEEEEEDEAEYKAEEEEEYKEEEEEEEYKAEEEEEYKAEGEEEYKAEEEEEYKADEEEEEEEYKEEEEEDYKVEEEEEEEEEEEYKVEEEEEEEEYKVEEEEYQEEEEDTQGVRKFNRSKAKNGVCCQQKNKSQNSHKRGRIADAEQPEEEDEEEEDQEEKEKDEDGEEAKVKHGEEQVERDGYEEEEGDADEKEEGDEDENEEEEEDDFDYDNDDDEFTPEEEDSLDEEEEMRGRRNKNNCMKMGKKVLQKRPSGASTRGRKRRRRGSNKPLRTKRRKNGGLRKKIECDEDEDDFVDNGPSIKTTNRKKGGLKRRRLRTNSDSDCVSSGASDFDYTISEEEREQVREAKKLCGSLRTNLRSSSLLIKNEECAVAEDLSQQLKPQGRKGKEKIEESLVRKGKEKVEGIKSEVGKQVCGICLSEENKRRVRGVLNCCTHYFCFACIMEWAKVESRCPLCKQRFKTISKTARSTAGTGIDLREVVIQVPERDQVYQPSEEELRSYIDPYEYVICSECHQGGDDGLMLLCDICDSPAHTYCVGLGHEVPEGNWYCDGCRPVALGTSTSQAPECVAEPGVTIQSLPVRPPPALNVRESIDLNLSSPRAAFSQGFGHHSSSRLTGTSVEGASPVSGGGAPTVSERRWIHRQIHQLLSIDRTRTNVISTTSSNASLYGSQSQIEQSRGTSTQHTRTQDVGTSYHTFFEETLCNNTTQLMQNGALWPGLAATPPVSNFGQVHQFSRSNVVADNSLPPGIREECNFHIAEEQLQSMVKSHLKTLSQNIDLGQNTIKDIARSSMHTILAACGLEHMKSEVCSVPPPSVCPHIELMAGGQTSLIKGCCSSCFESFVQDVVKRILDSRISSQWLRLGL